MTDGPVMKNKVHVPEVWPRRAKPAVAVLSNGGAAEKNPQVHSTLCLFPFFRVYTWQEEHLKEVAISLCKDP